MNKLTIAFGALALCIGQMSYGVKLTCQHDGYSLMAVNETKAVKGGTRTLSRVVISDTLKTRGVRTIANIPASIMAKNGNRNRTAELIDGNMKEYTIDMTKVLATVPAGKDEEVKLVVSRFGELFGIQLDKITSLEVEVSDFNFNSPEEGQDKYNGKVRVFDNSAKGSRSHNLACTYSKQ